MSQTAERPRYTELVKTGLSPSQLSELDALARRRATTRAALVREAVQQMLRAGGAA